MLGACKNRAKWIEIHEIKERGSAALKLPFSLSIVFKSIDKLNSTISRKGALLSRIANCSFAWESAALLAFRSRRRAIKLKDDDFASKTRHQLGEWEEIVNRQAGSSKFKTLTELGLLMARLRFECLKNLSPRSKASFQDGFMSPWLKLFGFKESCVISAS